MLKYSPYPQITSVKRPMSFAKMIGYCDGAYQLLRQIADVYSLQPTSSALFQYAPTQMADIQPRLARLHYQQLGRWSSRCDICIPASEEHAMDTIDMSVLMADDMKTAYVLYFQGLGPVHSSLSQPDPHMRPTDEKMVRNIFLYEWLDFFYHHCSIKKLR